MSKTKEYLSFFLAAASKPWKMGAIAPSSKELAEVMLQKLKFGTTDKVVEIGPGTGAITQLILPRLKNPTQYIGLDINPVFIESLKTRFPGVSFQKDSAEHLGNYFKNGPEADHIVCSLPWTMWTSQEQKKLLESILKPLKPGGTFVTFAYWPTLYAPSGIKFRGLLEGTFNEIQISPIVWKNLPPAITYLGSK